MKLPNLDVELQTRERGFGGGACQRRSDGGSDHVTDPIPERAGPADPLAGAGGDGDIDDPGNGGGSGDAARPAHPARLLRNEKTDRGMPRARLRQWPCLTDHGVDGCTDEVDPGGQAHKRRDLPAGQARIDLDHYRPAGAKADLGVRRSEAKAQGAEPPVSALAEALGVTPRTVDRDLAALRAAGQNLITRGGSG